MHPHYYRGGRRKNPRSYQPHDIPYLQFFLEQFKKGNGGWDLEKISQSIGQINEIVKQADPLVKQMASIVKQFRSK